MKPIVLPITRKKGAFFQNSPLPIAVAWQSLLVCMGSLAGSTTHAVFEEGCPIITRIPFGDQPGRPGHLDHAVTFGLSAVARVSWVGYPGDHAILDISISQASLLKKPVIRPLWRCSEAAALTDWYSQSPLNSCLELGDTLPGYSGEASIEPFLQFWKEGQDLFRSRASPASRNLLREPLGLKAIRTQLRNCVIEAERNVLQRSLRLTQIHWLVTLRLLRDRKTLRKGKCATPAKKLHAIAGITSENGDFTRDASLVTSWIHRE